ncbi:MAG: hypothetical protein ABR878_15995 [Roseiarcus sp.]
MGPIHRNRRLATHDIQQNLNAPLSVEPLQHAQDPSKGAGDYAHGLPGLQTVVEPHQARLVEAPQQSFDDARRNRRRALMRADEPRHAKSPVDRAPTIPLGMEDDENISRKDRRDHFAQLACMTNRLVKARQEGPKALGAKVKAGHLFAMAQGLGDEPTLALSQGQAGIRPLRGTGEYKTGALGIPG